MASKATPAPAEKGLPCDVDAERYVLGSIMLDGALYYEAAGALTADDFSLEKHRRIFKRMAGLQERNEKIDRITIAHELGRYGELESCDGLSYLVSLDDGLPQTPHIESYVRIVKEEALKRTVIFTSQHMINRAMMGEESSAEILSGARETLLTLGVGDSGGPQTPTQIIEDFEGGITTFLDPSKRKQGVLTGFTKFDEYTAGLHEGDLVIIAGRPSMGKTAFAINIAQYVAMKQKEPVAIFSLEMSKESLLTRMLCSESRVDSQRFRQGYLNSDERKRLNRALGELMDAPIYIDDTAGTTAMNIYSKLRQLKTKHGKIALAVVDYLQLMGSAGRQENRNQEVTQQSRAMKIMAKDLSIPMVVLSQLNRSVETRVKGGNRPQLSDLRESGAIEQDADLVAFIFREEVYSKDRDDLKGKAELIIGKQRNGPVGTVNLVFLHGLTKFANRAEDTGDEPEPLLESQYADA